MLAVLLSFGKAAQAQWVVHDPASLTQSIVNSSNEMVNTAATAENMLKNWQETVKIYQQSKEYYDKLRSVSNLVKEARKVQQAILMTAEIGDIYVQNFDKMLTDKNFSDRELSAIASGYTRLLQGAGDQLSDLKTIVNPTDLSMTDKDRIDVVDKVYDEIINYRNLTVYFTRKNVNVSYLRSQKNNNTERIKALYGDNNKYW